MLRRKSPSFIKDSAGQHKSKNMLLKQQKPRLFRRNWFTICYTKVSSHRKPAILSVFFPKLAVQQTACPHQSSHYCCTQHSRYNCGWKYQPSICCPDNSRGIFCSSDPTWTRDANGRNHDV